MIELGPGANGRGHACDGASSDRKKCDTFLDLCVSSLRRGHANLLCIVPILTDDLRRGSTDRRHLRCTTSQALPETHLATSTMGEGEAIDEHVLSFCFCANWKATASSGSPVTLGFGVLWTILSLASA